MKVTSEEIRFPEAGSEIYWATLSYTRFWFWHDGPLLSVVCANGGRLTPSVLRRIAKEYKVNRGIPAPAEDGIDRSAKGLCFLLNDAVQGWPENLADRAQECAKLVKAKDEKLSEDHLASAITKLVWFLAPQGWTVFDRIAADGLRVRRSLPALPRMLAFYEKLEESGFTNLEARLRATISQADLINLPAGRIIDSLLLSRGRTADEAEQERQELRGFLPLLPQHMASKLPGLALKIQVEANDVFDQI